MTKVITTKRGHSILVDDCDFDAIGHLCWSMTSRGYIGRRDPSTRKYVLIHRVIMNAPEGLVVDHINGNKLDNRRCNLRVCTHRQNLRNQGSQPNTSSRFKGVYWHKNAMKWQVRITAGGRQPSLGMFHDEIEAARVYDAAARVHHGEFARLNFPNEVTV